MLVSTALPAGGIPRRDKSLFRTRTLLDKRATQVGVGHQSREHTLSGNQWSSCLTGPRSRESVMEPWSL